MSTPNTQSSDTTSSSTSNTSNSSNASKSNEHANNTARRFWRWRVVDIAAGAALGAVCGVLFWAFTGLSYGLFPALTLLLPGSASLLHAFFYFPATLAMLMLRKPGSAAYVLLIASMIEVVMGTRYSATIFIVALVQAAATEIVYAMFHYRCWTLGITVLAGMATALAYNFYLLEFFYQSFSLLSPRGLIGTACELVSGIVVAGFGSWVLYGMLLRTGVLDALGRVHAA